MLKKCLIGLIFLFTSPTLLAFAEGNKPRDPIQTVIGNSTNASSWYYLSGSVSPQVNIYGIEEPISSFQWYDYYNLYDILYSFEGSTPTANSWGVWRQEWGPYQNKMEPPRKGYFNGVDRGGGIWVCLPADESNTTIAVFESK